MGKIKKIMLSTVLAGGVWGSSLQVNAAHSFNDVSDRYNEAVNYLYNKKIVKGITEQQFGINYSIKRVDSAVMIANSRNLLETSLSVTTFKDVPTRAISAVESLKKHNIIRGKSPTRFGSNDTLTRGEAALILVKAYNLEESNPNIITFTDVSDRYHKAVNALLTHGIAKGKTNTKFGTNDPLTRGELALLLFQLEKKVEKEEGFEIDNVEII